MEETKKSWNKKSVVEFIKKIKATDDVLIDDSQRITCTCERCQKKTEMNKSYAFRNHFFRCSRCGYVVGPIIKSVPKDCWYVVHDETNTIEPQKWFGSENDAKEYVKLCGLSEDQINIINF